jgi:hypothetical protein
VNIPLRATGSQPAFQYLAIPYQVTPCFLRSNLSLLQPPTCCQEAVETCLGRGLYTKVEVVGRLIFAHRLSPARLCPEGTRLADFTTYILVLIRLSCILILRRGISSWRLSSSRPDSNRRCLLGKQVCYHYITRDSFLCQVLVA